MADQKKNDVAEALAAMARGAVSSETESPSGGIPSDTTVFGSAPARVTSEESSAGSRLFSLPEFRAPLAVPPEPPASFGEIPSADSRSLRQTRPSRPDSPSTLLNNLPPVPSAAPPPIYIPLSQPGERSAVSRPAIPERSIEASSQQTSSETNNIFDAIPEIIEDDDTIAAAPDASAFAPRASRKPAQVHLYANLFFRRTIIPILLTCGLMFPIIGIWSMIDPNAPLAAIGTGVETLLIVMGLILFLLGVVNAFHVRHVLANAAKHE